MKELQLAVDSLRLLLQLLVASFDHPEIKVDTWLGQGLYYKINIMHRKEGSSLLPQP